MNVRVQTTSAVGLHEAHQRIGFRQKVFSRESRIRGPGVGNRGYGFVKNDHFGSNLFFEDRWFVDSGTMGRRFVVRRC